MEINQVLEKIDFPVSLRPAMFVDKDGTLRQGVGQQVVREDTNQSLSFVSDTYGLITHGQCLGPVVQALDGMDFTMKALRMDSAGRRVLVHAISKKTWNVGQGDDVALSLYFANSYDRAQALKAYFGGFRFICSNGAVVAHPAFAGLNVNVRIIHSKYQTRKLDVVAMANSVASLYGAMDKQAETWREWNRTTIDVKALDSIKLNVLEPVVGIRSVDTVVDKIFRGRGQDGRLTLWSVFNGITEHYTDKGNASKTPVAGNINALAKSALAVTTLNDWAKENTEVLVRA
jgi:hypothetical protein